MIPRVGKKVIGLQKNLCLVFDYDLYYTIGWVQAGIFFALMPDNSYRRFPYVRTSVNGWRESEGDTCYD